MTDATHAPPDQEWRWPDWLKHLRRRTTTGRFIAEVDGLRFIAIALWMQPAQNRVLFRGTLASRALGTPVVATIGGMCYLIYLLHFPLISMIGRHTLSLGSGSAQWVHLLIQTGMIIPPMMLICGAYFAAIERPCMERDWPQRLAAWFREKPQVA